MDSRQSTRFTKRSARAEDTRASYGGGRPVADLRRPECPVSSCDSPLTARRARPSLSWRPSSGGGRGEQGPAGDVQPLDGGEPGVPPPRRQRAAPRSRRDRRPRGARRPRCCARWASSRAATTRASPPPRCRTSWPPCAPATSARSSAGAGTRKAALSALNAPNAVATSRALATATMSRSTRSSTDRNGSLHSTVRCAWSLSLRCTQSTVKSRPAAWAAMKSPRSLARGLRRGVLRQLDLAVVGDPLDHALALQQVEQAAPRRMSW